jgi:hypothetical protein
LSKWTPRNGFKKVKRYRLQTNEYDWKKQIHWPKLSKNADLEKLMREFGCTDDYVAEYPINNPEDRRRIGKLISGAGQARTYTAGIK